MMASMTFILQIFKHYDFHINLPISDKTRAAVDGTPSQIPAFFTYNLYLGVKVTQNVAEYLLHNVTYAPVKFEVDMSNG